MHLADLASAPQRPDRPTPGTIGSCNPDGALLGSEFSERVPLLPKLNVNDI